MADAVHRSAPRRLAALVVLGAFFALVPAAHAAGPTPAFALGPDGEAKVPGGGFAIVANEPCAGDFNGDGNQDVAVPLTRTDLASSGIVVMPGDGTGHVGAATVVVAQVNNSNSLHCVVGDFNGDGRDDIAAIEGTTSNPITIALGQANGSFTLSTVLTPPSSVAKYIAVGDINDDGKLDLAVVYKSPNEIIPYVGDGAGGFTATGISPTTLPAEPQFVTLANIDGETSGHTYDDALVGLISTPAVSVIGLADGSFASTANGQAFTAQSIVVEDWNSDGNVDVAFDSGTLIGVRRGDSSVAFPSDAGTYPSSTDSNRTPRSLVAADFNGDGVKDVVAGSGVHPGVPTRVWAFPAALPASGAASGLLASTVAGPFDILSTQGLARVDAADMNNDGRIDVIATVTTGGGFAVLLNTTPIPAAVTGAASPIGDTGATLLGKIGPSGIDTSYGVDFISPTGTVDHRPSVGTLSGTGTQDVSVAVTGLTPDTTYRYRVYATNANGTTRGRIRTFHTNVARPVSQSPPTLDGTANVGQVLTCGDGTWTGSPTLAVSWLRGGVAIAGQAAHTYTVKSGDAGSAISCRVTATNAGGSASADSPAFVVPGGGTGPGGAPTNVIPPVITGDATVGHTVACNAGTWDSGGTFTYAWLRDGAAITGATDPGYLVTKADAGHALTCRVTLTNAVGKATATSTARSVPKPQCVVPKLRGATVAAAKRKLSAANCRAGKVVRRAGVGVAVGRVLRTSPAAGARKPNGTKVKLIVRI